MPDLSYLPQIALSGVAVGCIYGLIGIGFCVIYNASGIVNFAQGAFVMMGGMIEPGCAVHILQGVQDPDVPWRHAVDLVSRIARDDVVLTLIKDGDHRLSRPEDLERLIAAVKEF